MVALMRRSILTVFVAGVANAAQIVIQSATVSALPATPGDPAWTSAPAVAVPLMAQILVAPRGGASGFVEVRALHTNDRIAFRLSWADATKTDTWDISNRFADGCAVQVPSRAGEIPAPMMGHGGGFVSIVRWRSLDPNAEPYPKAYWDYHRPDAMETTNPALAGKSEHLVAQGYGTLDRKPVQDAVTNGGWADGRWTVTLEAPRQAFLPATIAPVKGKKPAAAPWRGTAIPVAFAVWDGARGDRDGIKSISVWQWLSLDGTAPPAADDPRDRGALVFARYGCARCHGEGGKGGVPNPNAKGGLVNAINRVAEGFTDDEIKDVIRKGRITVPESETAPPPPLRMNSWGVVLGEDELDDLVVYLKSLLPKAKPGEDW